MNRHRTPSVLQKLGINSVKKSRHEDNNNGSKAQQKWLHAAKEIRDNFVVYHAKYLGSVVVEKPKGVEVVKDAVRKINIARQVRVSEVGNKCSKLQKVEIHISIEALKVIDPKTRIMICNRPLHRVSYCADDHADKRLFMFIAKDQETKTHHCFAFFCEKEAADLTLTLGQAFQMAYRRYVEKEKKEMKENKELMTIDKEIEKIKKEKEKELKKEPALTNGNSTPERGNTSLNENLAVLSPPPTPNYQSISNPYPTSPDIFSPSVSRNISFDAALNTSATKNEDVFDPFGNIPTTQTVNGSNQAIEDGGISLFPVDSFNQSNSFDVFNYSTSPKDEDFQTKYDPFADTPDWNSVASEEVAQTTQHSNINPFSEISASEQGVGFNPFGTPSTDQTPNGMNGSGQFDDFSTDDSNNDLFSRYLSNVVASRESSNQIKSADNIFVENNGVSGDLSAVVKNDVLLNEPKSNSFINNSGFTAFGSNNEQFEVNFDSNSSNQFNQFETSFDQLTLNEPNDAVLSEFQETNDSFGFDGNNSLNTSAQQEVTPSKDTSSYTKTIRPRPSSGIGLKSFGLRAPPTKRDIKAASTLPSPSLKTTATLVTHTPPPQPQDKKFEEKIISSSHILPNVDRRSSTDHLSMKSLPRTATTRTVQPLRDSISLASKSLDDLAGGDSNKHFNPFSASHDELATRQPGGIFDNNHANLETSLSS